MSIIRNRELSQFASFLHVNDASQTIGITSGSWGSVGVGTTTSTSKLTVTGDVRISGVVTAKEYFGLFSGVVNTANYALVSGISTLSLGLTPSSNVNTSGIITASQFYLNGNPLIDAIYETWYPGSGDNIYRILGNVGIGLSTPSQKLSVSGNISANQFISEVTTGTSPFNIQSTTLVTNLNADFLRGKVPPTGTIVGTTDSQTLTNKTLTLPVIGSSGAVFNGTSGSTTLQASASASGVLTLPANTGTLVSTGSIGAVTSSMILDGTITNVDISASASISINKLSAFTISGISLGNNLNTLTIGSYLNGTSYNGSSAVTISAHASVNNVSNTLVARDSSGDFSSGSITCSNLYSSFNVNGTAVNCTDVNASTITATTIDATNVNATNVNASIVVADDINSTSDKFLKGNIKNISNSIEILNNLRGVSFNWKRDGKASYGVIAQEVESILPELVYSSDLKSVNYNGLIAFLIEGIKELSKEIKELKESVK